MGCRLRVQLLIFNLEKISVGHISYTRLFEETTWRPD